MKRIALLLTLATLIIVPLAIAQMHGPDHEDMAAFVTKALQLTPDQQAVFQQAHRDFEVSSAPLLVQRRQIGQQVETALKSPSPDACNIGNLMIQQHGISEQINAQHEQLKQKVYAVLTPEQKAKADQLMAGHDHDHAPRD